MMGKIVPIKNLDEIKEDQRICDFCNLKDTEDEIRCPNGGVPVPLEPINAECGIYDCFGVPVKLTYNKQ